MNLFNPATACGLFLRTATASWPPVRTAAFWWTTRFGKHLGPVIGQVIVDDGGGNQTGVDHLKQIVVFQILRHLLKIATGGLPLAFSASLSVTRLSW